MIEIATIPIVPFTQTDTIRLISTAYIDEPAMTPLADDDEALAFLEELEGLTSARRGIDIILPSGVFPEELLTERHGYGWSYVNAAFCYTRATGNRFNGPDRGAWYATWGKAALKTAHAEVGWHLTRELTAIGVFDNTTTYRELRAAFATRMHDLSAFRENLIFAPNPDISYPAGQTLASNLRAAEANGVLYPSMRHKGGHCLAAFRPNTVQNIRQGDTWIFTWSGNPKPRIEKPAS